ncbi:MAG: T9SS type A sorting domain-containing protein, partial [Bacteroidota bacterium]
GNYYVIVTDVNGCSSTSNIVYVDITGISENAALSVAIVPNPNNGTFELSWHSGNENIRINIVNVLGETIYAENFFTTTGKKRINSGVFSQGVYFVKISSGKETTTKKMIVR